MVYISYNIVAIYINFKNVIARQWQMRLVIYQHADNNGRYTCVTDPNGLNNVWKCWQKMLELTFGKYMLIAWQPELAEILHFTSHERHGNTNYYTSNSTTYPITCSDYQQRK